jgi:PBSX family phage terminase large subunit
LSLIDTKNNLNLDLNYKQSLIWDTLFDEKLEIIDSHFKEFGMWGGYRSGKSLLYMLIAHTFCSRYNDLNLLYCRATYGQLEDSVIQQFLALFPEQISGYTYRIQKREARFHNGSVINFRAFDKDKKILSTEYDAAFFCQAEEIRHALYLQVMGRLSGQKLPKNFIFVEGNPEDECWPKERYINPDTNEFRDDLKERGILCVKVETTDNKDNLPHDYISRLEEEYPDDWIQKYIYGNWTSLVGRVYSEFRHEEHIVKPFEIPKHWKRLCCMDHGTENPSAMLWLAISESEVDEHGKTRPGRLFVYDEYYERRKLPEELAEANKRHGDITTVADYSMKVKIPKANGTFGSVWGDLEALGVKLIEATKDKKANILLVNSLFKQNRLYIFDTCTHTIKEHKKYMYKKPNPNKEENIPEEVVKKDDHTCDALQYGVRWLKDQKVFEPTPYPKEKTLAYLTAKTTHNDWENLG